jgi:hypothetical protein
MTAPPRPAALPASLCVARSDAQRDAAIVAWLDRRPPVDDLDRRLVLAEGVLFDRTGPQGIIVRALAAGCPCCIGRVALRVALARCLRSLRPTAVLLLVADERHRERVRGLLAGGELGLAFSVEE